MNIQRGVIAKRRSSEAQDLKRLAQFLKSVAREPETHLEDERLIAALSSQGALAKYAPESPTSGGMSLNHQKRVAEAALGSFRALDELRKSAAAAIANARRSAQSVTRARRPPSETIAALKGELNGLKEDLVLFQRAYDLRCSQARNYAAEAGPSVRRLCAKEQKEIDATLSLKSKSLTISSVVLLRA